MRARLLVAGPIAVVASLVLATSASAANLGETAQVTTNTDNGGPGCELRDAITAVETDTQFGNCPVVDTSGLDDHVTFAPAMSGQTITLGGSGQLIVNDTNADIDFTGPGMNQLTISGNDASRVFLIQTRTAITGMSLVHGKALVSAGAAQGGAIQDTANVTFGLVLTDVKVASSAADVTSGTGTTFADGAGIHATGPLFLNQSVVTGNTATASGTSSANAEARGGAIFSEDDIQVTDSTISGNQATASTVGPTTGAQAISGIRSDSELDMSGSTVSGNIANADAPGTGSTSVARGALYVNSAGPASDVEQSTIADNKGDASGAAPTETGGVDIANDVAIRSSTIALNGPNTATGVDGANIRVDGGANEIGSTIIAGPRGGGTNCTGGTLTSDGFNDDSSPAGVSCLDTPLSTDLTSNPLLAAAGLGNNGGLTQTIALQPTSPMIDTGSNASLDNPNQDQRGASFPRPVDFSGLPNADNGTDIGAFEVQQACSGFTQPTPSTACPAPPSPPAQQPTAPVKKKKCKKAKKGASSAKKKKCKKKKK